MLEKMMLIHSTKSLLRNLFFFRFINVMRESEFKSMTEMANHILLFVSALVPKALASLMTSFCIELAKPENVSTLLKIYMGEAEFVYLRFLSSP